MPHETLTRSALEDLYLRLERPLFNVVYRWVWDREEAQELVQETFLRLWGMRERIRIETVESLAYRIGQNLAANRRRSRKLWQWVNLGAIRDRSIRDAGPDELVGRNEVSLIVKDAIDALPDRLRRVILLCEYSEMSYQEIALVLRVPVGTVGSRRNAALKRLRATLGPLLGE